MRVLLTVLTILDPDIFQQYWPLVGLPRPSKKKRQVTHTALESNHTLAYLLHLLVLYCTGAKDVEKKFLPEHRLGQDGNQEKATRLKPTRLMAPLTCELWHVVPSPFWYLILDMCSRTWRMFSYQVLWSVIAPFQRIQKKLPPLFLFLTSRNCIRTSYQSMYCDHI